WSLGGLAGAALGWMAATARIAPLTHFCVAAVLSGALTVAIAFPRLLDDDDAAGKRPATSAASRKFVWPPRVLLALGILAFCIMMGEGAMGDWSALYLRDSAGATEAQATMGYAAFSIAMAAARFSGDALSARFGPVALVRTGSALAAAGLSLALILPYPA